MTHAKRTLLIVRAHKADVETLGAYDRYASLGTMDVLLSCDERGGTVAAGHREKAFYNLDVLQSMGLFAHPKCGWRCGDYAYYTARAARPDYDFYWMVEPDVLIHTADLAGMLSTLNAGDADLLACRFGPRDARWDWHRTMCAQYPAVYGCIFPFTRLSGRAVDHLYCARKNAPAPDGDFTTWPNDEVFVATELMNNGFACHDLGEQRAGLYTRQSFRTGLPHDLAALVAQPPDEMIHHPVRDLSVWLSRISQNVDAIGTEQRGAANPPTSGALRVLLEMASVALEHDHLKDEALLPLMLAGPGTARFDAAARGNRGVRADVKLRRHFGAPERQAAGTAHIIAGLGAALGLTPAAQDFRLAAPVPVRRMPERNCLPYAFDFSKRTLLATLHACPRTVLQAGLLIDAQRRTASVACITKFEALESAVAGFSGRLPLQVLTDPLDDTPALIRHPPALTQLAGSHDLFRVLTRPLQRALLHAAIAPYVDHHGLAAMLVTADVAQWLRSTGFDWLDVSDGNAADETSKDGLLS